MSEDTYSTDGPQCPHCLRQYTADEPHYYDESNYTEDECDNCGGKFTVDVYHSVSWSCEAISPPPEQTTSQQDSEESPNDRG